MSIRMMLLLGLMLAGSAGALAACAGAREGEGGATATGERTTVRVVNERSEPVVVYVVRFEQRTRLKEVGSGRTEVLDIPPTLVNGTTELRFLVDFLSTDRPPLSKEMTVGPGDDVEIIVPAF